MLSLSREDKITLLDMARKSIENGLDYNEIHDPNASNFSPPLQEFKSSFCTLYLNKELRGCIGTLEAKRELIIDVAKNAHASAFKDSRFSPISKVEFDRICIHLSVLSTPCLLDKKTEAELFHELAKNKYGVVMRSEHESATFLPSVWSSLPDVKDFISQLKNKAGIDESIPYNDIEYSVYTVEEFSDENDFV